MIRKLQARHVVLRRRTCVLALAVALLCGPATLARAEIHVEGNAAAVRISTDRAALSDVLSAIAKTFQMSYRTAIPLTAATDPTYAGTFGQVISHLLTGYNYVIRRDGDVAEIVVYGRRGEVAIPPPAPKPASFLSRWR
jgi:hypothetical protein